jgi:hypothetical protein
VSPGTIVVAALLAGWGPVWPAPEQAASEAVAAAAPPAAAASTTPAPVAPPVAAPVPARPPAIIAKAPIDVRARPVMVTAPRHPREPRTPIHKQWAFWAIAGGLLVTTVVATIVATRPTPDAYRGNTSPYYVPFQ